MLGSGVVGVSTGSRDRVFSLCFKAFSMSVFSRVLLHIAILLSLTSSTLAQVHVRGYYRKDGTYVRSHYRSRADGNFWNNWSTKGNRNPYTGKVGTLSKPPRGYGGHQRFDSFTSSTMPTSSWTDSFPIQVASTRATPVVLEGAFGSVERTMRLNNAAARLGLDSSTASEAKNLGSLERRARLRVPMPVR